EDIETSDDRTITLTTGSVPSEMAHNKKFRIAAAGHNNNMYIGIALLSGAFKSTQMVEHTGSPYDVSNWTNKFVQAPREWVREKVMLKQSDLDTANGFADFYRDGAPAYGERERMITTRTTELPNKYTRAQYRENDKGLNNVET